MTAAYIGAVRATIPITSLYSEPCSLEADEVRRSSLMALVIWVSSLIVCHCYICLSHNMLADAQAQPPRPTSRSESSFPTSAEVGCTGIVQFTCVAFVQVLLTVHARVRTAGDGNASSASSQAVDGAEGKAGWMGGDADTLDDLAAGMLPSVCSTNQSKCLSCSSSTNGRR